MRHLKHITLMLMAAFLLAGITATTALAEAPEILPIPTVEKPATFTLSGPAGKLLIGKDEIKCTEFSGEGSFTTQDSGKISKLDFKGCENESKVKCSTEPDAAGTILTENADVNIVDYKGNAKLLLGIVISPLQLSSSGVEKDVLIICGKVFLITTLGGVMGKLAGPKNEELLTGVVFKEILALFNVKEKVQELLECELLKVFCAKGPFDIKAKLTAEGAEINGFLEQPSVKVKFAKPTELSFDF